MKIYYKKTFLDIFLNIKRLKEALLQVFVNFPETKEANELFFNNLTLFKVELLLRSIENINVKDEVKDKVLEKILEILSNRPSDSVI